jgi:hypothetical protein
VLALPGAFYDRLLPQRNPVARTRGSVGDFTDVRTGRDLLPQPRTLDHLPDASDRLPDAMAHLLWECRPGHRRAESEGTDTLIGLPALIPAGGELGGEDFEPEGSGREVGQLIGRPLDLGLSVRVRPQDAIKIVPGPADILGAGEEGELAGREVGGVPRGLAISGSDGW